MVKPIFVVMMPHISAQAMEDQAKKLEKKLNDYHVLFVLHDGDDIGFEGYYPKDFPEVEFDAFKKELTEKYKECIHTEQK